MKTDVDTEAETDTGTEGQERREGGKQKERR
jgi:hypothetical protein